MLLTLIKLPFVIKTFVLSIWLTDLHRFYYTLRKRPRLTYAFLQLHSSKPSIPAHITVEVNEDIQLHFIYMHMHIVWLYASMIITIMEYTGLDKHNRSAYSSNYFLIHHF